MRVRVSGWHRARGKKNSRPSPWIGKRGPRYQRKSGPIVYHDGTSSAQPLGHRSRYAGKTDRGESISNLGWDTRVAVLARMRIEFRCARPGGRTRDEADS